MDYHAEPQRQPVVEWLKARGFIPDGCLLVYCWSSRCGLEHVTLEFYPLARHARDEGWDAIVGHHASGTNPRMAFGTCETLADVQMAYHTIRLLNGYGKPEDERVTVDPLAISAKTVDTDAHSS
jgi:hypothetical protein